MARLNCIIVDDDTFSTKIMSGYIGRTSGVAISQCFCCAVDAINYLSTPEGRAVNIVFLDIEMPDLNGIDFMRAADLRNKEVIIYSSQEKYALESYEYDVCDYLLKPVSYARFVKAIGKARIALAQRSEDGGEEVVEDSNFAILRDNQGCTHKLNLSEVVAVEAEQNYVSIKATTKEILVHLPMKKVLEMMPENIVCRIHRSFAVGLRYISKIDKDIVSVDADGLHKEYPLSRSFSQNLKKALNDLKESGKDGGAALQ